MVGNGPAADRRDQRSLQARGELHHLRADALARLRSWCSAGLQACPNGGHEGPHYIRNGKRSMTSERSRSVRSAPNGRRPERRPLRMTAGINEVNVAGSVSFVEPRGTHRVFSEAGVAASLAIGTRLAARDASVLETGACRCSRPRINLSLGHPIYEPAATDPLVQAVEKAVERRYRRRHVWQGTWAADPRTKEIGYARHHVTGQCAVRALTVGAARHARARRRARTTWSRGTARAARRGTTGIRSRISWRQGTN